MTAADLARIVGHCDLLKQELAEVERLVMAGLNFDARRALNLGRDRLRISITDPLAEAREIAELTEAKPAPKPYTALGTACHWCGKEAQHPYGPNDTPLCPPCENERKQEEAEARRTD